MGGGSLLNHHQCAASTWMMRRLPQDNGTSALATHRLQVERRESKCKSSVCSHHNQLKEETRERDIDPIKSMRSPHTSYRWRGESQSANQVDALTTNQLQVERRERHRPNQVYALATHQLQVERRERHRPNQVYALATHQLQVERRERHRPNQVYALATHQLQVERRESKCQSSVCSHHNQLKVERRERHRPNQEYALATHQLQVERRESKCQSSGCSHHTPATGGEERET